MEVWSTGQLVAWDEGCAPFAKDVWSIGHEAGTEGAFGGCCFANAEWSTGQLVDEDDDGIGTDGCWVEDEVDEV